MNILLITNLFPTPLDPERGIFTLQLVKRLKEHCKVTVICPLPWFPNWKFLASIGDYRQYSGVPYNYTIDGVEVYSPKYPLIPKISRRLHAQLMASALKSCIKKSLSQENFDLINSQWLYPDGVAADRLSKALNLPHVPTGLGCDINRDLYDDNKNKQIIGMLENSEAVIVVSNSLRQEINGLHINQDNISVIPNGIDFEKFGILSKSSCREKLGIVRNLPVYLYVGRLSEEKGVASLIEAAGNRINSGAELELYLVGDGPLLNELGDLAISLKISDRVHFVGKVEHSNINCWMGAADYFCLPSLREGCPNVVLEALSSGRPVLASKVGAIPDIVTSNSGILFEPQNIDSISNALQVAISSHWNENDIHDSVKSLSWEATAEKYIGVFRKVLDRRSQA